MSLAFQRPALRIVLLVATLILASTFTYSLGAATAGASSEPAALLKIGETDYRFSPTTCAVADNDFVASGTGTVDGQTFWVSASSDLFSLALGAEHRIEDPEPGHIWLTNGDRVQWRNADGAIVGSVTLRDERKPDTSEVLGQFSISCPTL